MLVCGCRAYALTVVEGSKDVGSVGIIVLGLGLAGIECLCLTSHQYPGTFIYSITSELFFRESPTYLYERALKRLQTEGQV